MSKTTIVYGLQSFYITVPEEELDSTMSYLESSLSPSHIKYASAPRMKRIDHNNYGREYFITIMVTSKEDAIILKLKYGDST